MESIADVLDYIHRRALALGAGKWVVVRQVFITRLKEQRYLDDQSFAETYTRLRQENEKLGARGVRRKLAQKGVPTHIAEEAVESRYSDTDEEALARKHLEQKRIAKPTNEKETARVMRRLVAAGFSTGVIYKILRQWDVPDEALSALDNLEETEDNG